MRLSLPHEFLINRQRVCLKKRKSEELSFSLSNNGAAAKRNDIKNNNNFSTLSQVSA